MHKKVRYILCAGFGALLIIVALLGAGSLREARRTFADSEALHAARTRESRLFSDLRINILRSGIVVRDYLLDISHITAPAYKEQLVALRKTTMESISELSTSGPARDDERIIELTKAIEDYWDSLEPVFDWTPKQKMASSYVFLRAEVLPRRRAVADLIDRIKLVSDESLKLDELRVQESSRQLRWLLARLTAVGLALGIVVAAVGIWRISHLERLATLHLHKIEQAERELRSLSQQLVRAQEEERKRISRELHDEVGQKLTALRYTLGALSRSAESAMGAMQDQLEEAKALTEQNMKTVRNIAMGLRPSMLDDLGLGPAVDWLAREASRTTGIPVTVEVEGTLDHLQDRHRTAVFRIVQESLTNCARHAHARSVRVLLHGSAREFTLIIQDDGVGFESGSHSLGGLGIVGMKERAAELGGEIEWITKPGKGTQVRLWLPLVEPEVAA